jgi:hypothetical protein
MRESVYAFTHLVNSQWQNHHQKNLPTMSTTHPALHPPLPALTSNQKPQTLSELAHFLSGPPYTETNHPDKFSRWTKGLLDRILPLDVYAQENQSQGQAGGSSQGQQQQGQGPSQGNASNANPSNSGNSFPQTAYPTQSQFPPQNSQSYQNQNQNPQSTQNQQTQPAQAAPRDFHCSDLELQIVQREIGRMDGELGGRWGLLLWIL